MITVYKYLIPSPSKIDGRRVVEMPTDSHIVHVDIQDGKFYAWALVDTEKVGQSRKMHFLFSMTGQEITAADLSLHGLSHEEVLEVCKLSHFKTFLLDGGNFVIHVFLVEP